MGKLLQDLNTLEELTDDLNVPISSVGSSMHKSSVLSIKNYLANTFLTKKDDGSGEKFLSDDGLYKSIMAKGELSFYCIEQVNVVIDGVDNVFDANKFVTIYIGESEFEIITTSDKSILILSSFPKPLDVFYEWLEGVSVFSNIIFNMNDLSMYEKWNQGHQGQYHVQFAQYVNCIFWSDNAYISDVSKRTNYTIYNSSELPLCYSTIKDNTFKSFYMAYNVTKDPNWSNQDYRDSFSKATWATQAFSYYGLHSIGMFDMDSSDFNIVLPKDCRGLMFYAPNVLNAGVFDAINVTNFGAKSGSWRDAFAYCSSLKNLYIKNLKVNLNVSWSPISIEALSFIVENAVNTSKITISLSPYTYYRLDDTLKTLAESKNITLELLSTNMQEDTRIDSILDRLEQLENDNKQLKEQLDELNELALLVQTE